MTGDRRVAENSQTHELEVQHSTFDHYAARSNHLDINLIDFASEFSVCNGERSNPVIIRAFPVNPHGEHYFLYCKHQLVKYKPWHLNVSNLLDEADDCDESWISQYHSFLTTESARQTIPHFYHDLQFSQQWVDGNTSDPDSEHDDDYHDQELEQWMQLCQLNPQFITPQNETDFDWAADAIGQLMATGIKEAPDWISSQRRLSTDPSQLQSPWHRQLPTVNVHTLNPKQRHAYDIISDHQTQIQAGTNPEPLHMIISGTAGTGKSYLINALNQLLGDSCILTGTTGTAGLNICGITLHSALQLPIQKHSNRDQRL